MGNVDFDLTKTQDQMNNSSDIFGLQAEARKSTITENTEEK